MTTADAKDKSKKANGTAKTNGVEHEGLSEEDLELQQRLEGLVATVIGEPKFETAPLPTLSQRKDAIEALRKEVRSASATVAAIPKALKFLGRHYARLKHAYKVEKADKKTLDVEALRALADVLSVVAMAYSDAGESACESLKFRLDGTANTKGDAVTRGSLIDLDPWGQEYVRSLVGELTRVWNAQEEGKQEDSIDKELLELLVDSIVPFQLKHSCEPDAVDLLLEVEQLDKLSVHIDKHNYSRVCLYLLSSCHFLPPPDDKIVLECAFGLYQQVGQYAEAAIVAIKLNDVKRLQDSFKLCAGHEDTFLLQCQIAYIAIGSNHGADLTEIIEDMEDSPKKDTLEEIVGNSKLSEHYLNVARDLDVMEAKTPEDVFKQHLVETRGSGVIDTARQHLASAFVNGFVNAGFCKDKLISEHEEDEANAKGNIIFKNKDHGKVSAAASIGLISLWDVDGGLPQVDKYFYSKDMNILAGALLAVGTICAGTQSDCDPALALLAEHLSVEEGSVSSGNMMTKMAAIFGLGLAYAGNVRPAVRDLLLPIMTDDSQPLDVIGHAALAIGLIHAGTANDEAVQTLLQVFMMRGKEFDVSKLSARLTCMGLALLFVRKGDEADAILEVVKTFDKSISRYCHILIDTMAYTATGNVLKVQQMLAMISDLSQPASQDEDSQPEGKDGSKSTDTSSSRNEADIEHTSFVAVLGVALISLAEDVGMSMAHRNLEHILQFGDKAARKAVPIAYALLRVSDPDVALLDTMGRLTHDSDSEVAHNAILSLGIMGAGTNHARIATMLRNLSGFYYKDSASLFIVRIAQGLVHLGKGLLTLSPHRADRNLVSNVALSCISTLAFLCSDMKGSILGNSHYMLYILAPAMQPRIVVTLEEEKDSNGPTSKLQPVPITCHVGTAVDVVGQAGKPKTITGFQTHNTPVLLGVGERVELANEKYISLAPFIEHFVLVKSNPDYVE